MAVFQLLAATINIAGSRDHTVVRAADDPITYPEMLVLQAVHGGVEHVHGAVVVGSVERDHAAERDRLNQLYGMRLVSQVFPGAAHMPLPLGDDTLPTIEEEAAAAKAAAEAAAKVRASKAKPGTKSAATPAAGPAEVAAKTTDQAQALVPDLTAAKK